jgi:hypothetical protein
MATSVYRDLLKLAAEQVDNPADASTLVLDWIEEELSEVLSTVEVPPLRSFQERQVDYWRLTGRPGFRQYRKSVRPLIQRQFEAEDFWEDLRASREGRQQPEWIAGSDLWAPQEGVMLDPWNSGCNLVPSRIEDACQTIRQRPTRAPESSAAEEGDEISAVATSAAPRLGIPFEEGINCDVVLPLPTRGDSGENGAAEEEGVSERARLASVEEDSVDLEFETVIRLSPMTSRVVEVEITHREQGKPRIVLEDPPPEDR